MNTNKEESIRFTITVDMEELQEKLTQIRQQILESGKFAASEAKRIEQVFSIASVGASAYFNTQESFSFGKDILKVYDECQLLKNTFEDLFKSRTQAQAMVKEVIDLAVDTPLEIPQISDVVKNLLGLGVEGQKVMEVVGQLSDISLGSSSKFKSLADVFGKVQSEGKLLGEDLTTMIGAGFNPLQSIAGSTGKVMSQLKDDLSNGAISAMDVSNAFKTATSEGGLFYQMTQKQSEGAVKIKLNFQDLISNVFGKMSETNRELGASSYEAANVVAQSSGLIGESLRSLINAYGSKKAALIAVSETEKNVGDTKNTDAWMNLAKGISTVKGVQQALNGVMEANPLMRIISLIMAAGVSLFSFSKRIKDTKTDLSELSKVGENLDIKTEKIVDETDKKQSPKEKLTDFPSKTDIVSDEKISKEKRYTAELKKYEAYSREYLQKYAELKAQKAKIEAQGESGGEGEAVKDTIQISSKTASPSMGEKTTQIDNEINTLNNAFSKNTENFQALAEDLVNENIEHLVSLLEQVQTVMGEEGGIKELGAENTEALRAKIESLTSQLKGGGKEKSETTNTEKQDTKDTSEAADAKQWNETKKALKGVAEVTNNVIDGFEGMSDKTKAIFKSVGAVTSTSISMIGEIEKLSQGSIKAVDGTAKASAASMSAMEKASTILTIVSLAIQLITTVINLFKSAKKAEAEAIKHSREEQQQAVLAEYELAEAKRANYEWELKLGETRSDNFKRNQKEMKAQKAANEEQQQFLMKSLMNSTYVETNYTKRGKEKQTEISLAGKTFEEIELLAAEGKLSEEGQKFYDALKKAKEEGANLADMELQMLEDLKEFYTGTTTEDVAQGIIDGFMEGKHSAADFADDFEDMMRSSMTNALADGMNAEIEEWRKQYAAMASDEDGLTQEEIEELRKKYNEIIENQAKAAEDMEEITGIKFNESDSASASQNSAIQAVQNLTQEQGNEFIGRITAMQILVSNIDMHTSGIQMLTDGYARNLLELRPNIISSSENLAMIASSAREQVEKLLTIAKHTAMLETTNIRLQEIVSYVSKL